MNDDFGLPGSVEGCEKAVADLGLKLDRQFGGDQPTFVLHDPSADNEQIETFHSPLWTDLDCAQAAVRFARYFTAEAAPEARSEQ